MGDKKQSIKCSDCEYCKGYRRIVNTRTGFTCNHPEQRYILDYFMQKGLRKMPGFLGFSVVHSETVPLKTSPAWCPKKK